MDDTHSTPLPEDNPIFPTELVELKCLGTLCARSEKITVRRIAREEERLYCMADVGAFVCGRAIQDASEDVRGTIA